MDPRSYTSGERVFGPPSGTFDSDWAATALRSNRPELDHATSVRLMDRAWDLLQTRGIRAQALTDALQSEAPKLDSELAAAVSAVATETAELYLDRT